MHKKILQFLRQQWQETIYFFKGYTKKQDKSVKHCRCCRACGACPRGKL